MSELSFWNIILGLLFILLLLFLWRYQKIIRKVCVIYSGRSKEVVIVNSAEECLDALKFLKSKCTECNVLGFDCEWVTTVNGRNPISLLQLSSYDGFCVLIRLCKFPLNIPLDLKMLLDNPLILKVGVVPSDDAKYLLQDYGIVVRGCLDLRHIIVRNGATPKGLSGLAESILGFKMDKSWTVRCSDWEADELTERQIQYSANDALAAVDIFQVVASGQPNYLRYIIMQSIKEILTDLKLYSEKCLVTVPSFVYEYVDIKFHNKVGKSNKIVKESTDSSQTFATKQKPMKPLKPATRAFSSRQSPLYHNCFMQAPDGAVLCTCDRKKAIWYVSKGLADLICDTPLTVRLKFEPSGRAVGTVGQYYVQPKSNCCVVCGKVDNCIRKNVVPHEYRKHFPKIMKDHVSHDVLLLCLPCHLQSNNFDMVLRYRLADICKAPFCQGGNSKYMENRELCGVRAAAKALIRNDNKIPQDRQTILQETVKEHYGLEELTEDLLQEAAKLNANVLNKEYDPHGLKVVQYFTDGGGLIKLEQMWREHFLQTMHPKYMPNLWSVTHTQDRLAIRAAENRVKPDELLVAGMKDCVPLLDEAKLTKNILL